MYVRRLEIVSAFACIFLSFFLIVHGLQNNPASWNTSSDEYNESTVLDSTADSSSPILPTVLQPKQHLVPMLAKEKVATLLQNKDVDPADIRAVTILVEKHKFKPVPGQHILLEVLQQEGRQRLQKLAFLVPPAKRITLIRTEDTFELNTSQVPVEKRLERFSGTVQSNLFTDARRAGAPAKFVREMISSFSHVIDFQRDLRSDDRFELVTQTMCDDETGCTLPGPLLYAGLTARGAWKKVYRFDGANQGGYYAANGESMRRNLLQTPIPGVRISSHFGSRMHPILGFTKMHKGVDFAAGTGTPILAAGNGTVARVGRYGSYGNYILIKHNGQYATAYAHLSRFAKKLRVGQKVKQGDVIGYVGMTGRASGPHLHYEVLEKGVQINPKKVKSLSNERLSGKAYKTFKNQIQRMDVLVAQMQQENARLARWEGDTLHRLV